MSEAFKGSYLVSSVNETVCLGRRIGEAASRGSIIGLRGPLGAGKTELVRGIAQGLGIEEDISSPTFVLEAVYDARPPSGGAPLAFHHWDLYRITTGEIDCELFDYAGDETKLTAVEWPERVPAVEDLLDVDILIDFVDSGRPGSAELGADTGQREITVVVHADPRLAAYLAAQPGR